MYHKIKTKVIFVADSHFNDKNQELLIFLEKLLSKKIETSQLFLMGDIFDFLSAQTKYFINKNKKIINLINKISLNMEVFYFEGNHDYNLKELFPNIVVIKRENQPMVFSFDSKLISLSHGDIFTPKSYDLYCKVIRNRYLLRVLDFIDFRNIISKIIYNKLMNKKICSKMSDFEKFAKKRTKYFNTDYIIEGHFHQGKEFSFDGKTYINIPSLVCSKEYLVYENNFIKKRL